MLVRLRHLLRAPRLIFVLSAVNAYKGRSLLCQLWASGISHTSCLNTILADLAIDIE